MNISTLPATHLSDERIAAWTQLQRENSTLDGPFFCPDFVRLVAEERAGVEVAELQENSRPVGFFPYYRDRGNVGRPIVGRFSDFQGLVCPADLEWEPFELLRACGLSAWCFDGVLASQAPASKYHFARSQSTYLDLSSGFEAYRLERRSAGSDELRETLRKSRKIERDVAPLRFEAYSQDLSALDTLIRWKRDQLQALKRNDCFSESWVVPMLERVAMYRGQQFSGMLSTLHAGETLLAVNLGMRSDRVLHGWVTAFNREYRKFSPGLLLIVKLAQAAESLGIRRIDMGRGDESFKRSFASGAIPLAEGAVDLRWMPRLLTRGWICAKELVRGTSLDRPARKLLDCVKRPVTAG